MTVRFYLLFATALVFCFSSSRLLADETANTTIENEFIKVVVNKGPQETGRFAIDTTGGDPRLAASKNQQLIYGGKTPWTSITTIRIDDATFVFGGKTERRSGLNANYGEPISQPTVEGNVISTSYRYGDIVVTQELGFARGMMSRMLDSAMISYRFSNEGKVPHRVGLRILLDTKLGANDGAPFRCSSMNEAVTSPVSFTNTQVPAYWQAFDDLDNPNVVAQCTLRDPNNGQLTPPDQITFADWGTLADEVWEPTLNRDQGFVRKGEDEEDTATALYWNPESIDPGKSLSRATAYGIGYVHIEPGKLRVGASVPSDTTYEYERTQPFDIMGYVSNAGDFDGANVKLTIKLPEGISLVPGVKAAVTAETLKTKGILQGSWTVIANGKAGGAQTITLEASSDNLEANAISQPVQVYIPKPKLVLLPGTVTVPLLTSKEPTTFFVAVNLKPAVEFYGARFVLTYDPAILRLPRFNPVYRGEIFADGANEQLLNGWECDTSEKGKIVITARRGNKQPLTRAEINLVSIAFRVISEGKSALTLESAMLINDKGEESPVATSAGAVEVKANLAR